VKLVIADASPIHYLVLIGAAHVLPEMFTKVVIPEHIVSHELRSPRTPPLVRNWAANLPPWAEARTPANPETLGLDTGEEHAIALAIELGAPLLLDEKEARKAAKEKGLIVIGTIGIIERAADLNLLDIGQALGALRLTNAWISESLIDGALTRHARRVADRGGDPAPPQPEK
jgi:predicted nucleic acid-binding protein